MRSKKPKRDKKPAWLLPPAPTKSQAEKEREDFYRKYGSPERAAWVKERPCFALHLAKCGYNVGPCQGETANCHTATGGLGYKAGYETVTAGCARHHSMFDLRQPPLDEPLAREYVRQLAAITQAAWLAHTQL